MKQNIILCLGYVLAAIAARTVAIPPGNVVAVWPSTGIALAGVLIWGRHVLPGVFFGAFLGNFLQASGIPLWTSILASSVIGIGECGTVLAAALLLKRFVLETDPFSNIKNVSIFLAVILVADVISATFGTLALYTFGLLSAQNYLVTWITWYVGDTIGMFVFVPLIYYWRQTLFPKMSIKAVSSFILVLCACLGVSFFVFNVQFPSLYFLILIPVVSTFLFGRLAGMLTVVTLQLIGILISTDNHTAGPFHQLPFQQKLILLQIFYASLTLITLYFAALLTQLEEAVKVRDKFLSIASHELMTPLTGMKIQAQTLYRNASKSPSEIDELRVAKAATNFDRSIDRLVRLVDDMLDISRIQNGKLLYNKEKTELATLVSESLERLKPELENARIELRSSLDSGLIAEIDRFRIEQVLINLITNVIKYAPHAHLEVKLVRHGNNAVLHFKDSGPGIDKVNHEKIFRRFERLVSASQVSGLGLGLFICREIIEGHGGQIHIESEKGKGTTFVIQLPLDSNS